MRKNIFLYLLFILFAFFVSSSLRSDDFFKVKDKIIGESRFKLGFFYLTPLIFLENVGYTSSIYTYEEKDYPDWSGDFGLGLRASAIAANRLILQAESVPYYSFYLENKNLRSWSNRFTAAAYSHAGPFDFKAGFKYNDQSQRPQLEFSRPYHFSISEWSGQVEFGRRSGLFLTSYATFSDLAYDEAPYLEHYNLAEQLNCEENTFGFKLNKTVFTSTIIYANYERTAYHFQINSGRDTRTQKVALGIELPEIGSLQGGFQIGIRRFEPGNPFFRDVQRPSGRGDLRLTLAKRLHLNAFYELDTLFSYSASDSFYDNNMFGGGAEVYLTRFLKCGASYQDGRMKYHSFLDLELRRNDRIRNQRYYLAIPFFANTSLGFSYNVYRLTSDALGLDYTRNFWGGFVSHEF